MGFVKSSSAALLVAAAALTVLVGVASGGRLSFTNQSIEISSIEAEYTGALGTVKCPIDLLGVLHSTTVVKTAGGLSGLVTEALHLGCRQGEAIVLAETLPWHLRYRSFTGTLPTIATVAIDIVEYTVTLREPTFGIVCSIRSTGAQPMTLILTREAGGAVTGGRLRGTISSSCGFPISMDSPTLTPRIPNTLSRITVRLI